MLIYAKHKLNSAAAACDDCKLVVAEVHSLLKDKAVQEDVKEYILKLCGYIPGSEYQHLCREYIGGYWDQILNLLEGFLSDPDAACKDLGLCPGSQKAPLKFPHFGAMPATLQRDSSATCMGCKVPIDLLFAFLRVSNETRWAITHLVQDTICNILPTDVDLQCKDFIGIYGPPSLLLTFETFNGTTVCEAMSACKGDTTRRLFIVQEENDVRENGFIECETCRHFLQWIGGEMQTDKVQTDVVRFMQQLCDRITTPEKCQQMVSDARIRELMLLLGTELKIGHFCSKMNICPPEASP